MYNYNNLVNIFNTNKKLSYVEAIEKLDREKLITTIKERYNRVEGYLNKKTPDIEAGQFSKDPFDNFVQEIAQHLLGVERLDFRQMHDCAIKHLSNSHYNSSNLQDWRRFEQDKLNTLMEFYRIACVSYSAIYLLYLVQFDATQLPINYHEFRDPFQHATANTILPTVIFDILGKYFPSAAKAVLDTVAPTVGMQLALPFINVCVGVIIATVFQSIKGGVYGEQYSTIGRYARKLWNQDNYQPIEKVSSSLLQQMPHVYTELPLTPAQKADLTLRYRYCGAITFNTALNLVQPLLLNYGGQAGVSFVASYWIPIVPIAATTALGIFAGTVLARIALRWREEEAKIKMAALTGMPAPGAPEHLQIQQRSSESVL